MRLWTLFFAFCFCSLNAQEYKQDISIVQYSAPFTKDSEISLKSFKDYNTHKFCITEHKKIFDKENIKYLPTVVLYHNEDEIIRIESGISLKLPENTIKLINKEIDKIIENKF